MIIVEKSINGCLSSTGVMPPDVLKMCKRISLEGVFDENYNFYYPPHVIERIEIEDK